MALQIPGVPDGWEVDHVNRIGEVGEHCISDHGEPVLLRYRTAGRVCIIRKIEKPARYRPFANAEEYMPEADRKISRVTNDNQQMTGFARSTGCDSLGLWMGDVYCTWEEMLDRGHVFLDDGTPFGVKIDE